VSGCVHVFVQLSIAIFTLQELKKAISN